jgi:hypothetical protein
MDPNRRPQLEVEIAGELAGIQFKYAPEFMSEAQDILYEME